MRRRAVVLAAVLIGGVVVTAGARAMAAPAPGVVNAVSLARTDQLIVTVRGGAPSSSTLTRTVGQSARTLRRLGGSSYVVKLAAGQQGAALRATMDKLAALSGVVRVEPDERMFPL